MTVGANTKKQIKELVREEYRMLINPLETPSTECVAERRRKLIKDHALKLLIDQHEKCVKARVEIDQKCKDLDNQILSRLAFVSEQFGIENHQFSRCNGFKDLLVNLAVYLIRRENADERETLRKERDIVLSKIEFARTTEEIEATCKKYGVLQETL